MNTTGLTSILYNGVLVPIKFGLPACEAFYTTFLNDEEGKYGNETNLNTCGIAKLIHCGYENAVMVEDKKSEISYGQMLAWVEDMSIDDPEMLTKVVTVFENSKYTTTLIERTKKKNQDDKKKLIGDLSSLSASTSSDLPENSTRLVRTQNSITGSRGTNAQKPKKARKKR